MISDASWNLRPSDLQCVAEPKRTIDYKLTNKSDLLSYETEGGAEDLVL